MESSPNTRRLVERESSKSPTIRLVSKAEAPSHIQKIPGAKNSKRVRSKAIINHTHPRPMVSVIEVDMKLYPSFFQGDDGGGLLLMPSLPNAEVTISPMPPKVPASLDISRGTITTF